MKRKCPNCKKKLDPDIDQLYVEQLYTTQLPGTMDIKTGKVNIDDDGGYTLLDDFLNNMLVEKGKPKIVGCSNCM